MDLADMVAVVRQDLKDEDPAAYRWTDAELERHIAHAVKDFSQCCPLEAKDDEVDTVSGSREIDISALTDRIGVVAVEYPLGLEPVRYQRFALWSDTLTLIGQDVPDGSHCAVYYTQLHNADCSTVPAKFEDLVASGAAGYAAVAWAGYAINRVNVGGTSTPQDWGEWSREKLAFFRSELKRLGRRNKVRARQHYVPYC